MTAREAYRASLPPSAFSPPPPPADAAGAKGKGKGKDAPVETLPDPFLGFNSQWKMYQGGLNASSSSSSSSHATASCLRRYATSSSIITIPSINSGSDTDSSGPSSLSSTSSIQSLGVDCLGQALQTVLTTRGKSFFAHPSPADTVFEANAHQLYVLLNGENDNADIRTTKPSRADPVHSTPPLSSSSSPTSSLPSGTARLSAADEAMVVKQAERLQAYLLHNIMPDLCDALLKVRDGGFEGCDHDPIGAVANMLIAAGEKTQKQMESQVYLSWRAAIAKVEMAEEEAHKADEAARNNNKKTVSSSSTTGRRR